MQPKETQKDWGRISEEILVGMSEWRKQHAKATFAEKSTTRDDEVLTGYAPGALDRRTGAQ